MGGVGFQTIVVSTIIGSLTTLAGVLINNKLSFKREMEKVRLEAFERFMDSFERPQICAIRTKLGGGQSLSEEEVEQYLGFFEEVGLYHHRGYVDEELIDEIIGDSIIEARQDKKLMQHIAGVRTESGDKTYFRFFEALGDQLLRKQQQRRRA